MIVRDKEHLLNLKELLEANDAQLTRSWRRLDNEAEVPVLSLCYDDHVVGERHALDLRDLPYTFFLNLLFFFL